MRKIFRIRTGIVVGMLLTFLAAGIGDYNFAHGIKDFSVPFFLGSVGVVVGFISLFAWLWDLSHSSH